MMVLKGMLVDVTLIVLLTLIASLAYVALVS